MKEKNDKKQYLTEDQDLVDELESANVRSGHLIDVQNYKVDSIQIKSILRNRKTMVDLDKSNKKYTIAIGLFALVQIVIAGFQLILDIKIFPDRRFAVFIALLFIGIIIWFTKIINKKIN